MLLDFITELFGIVSIDWSGKISSPLRDFIELLLKLIVFLWLLIILFGGRRGELILPPPDDELLRVCTKRGRRDAF